MYTRREYRAPRETALDWTGLYEGYSIVLNKQKDSLLFQYMDTGWKEREKGADSSIPLFGSRFILFVYCFLSLHSSTSHAWLMALQLPPKQPAKKVFRVKTTAVGPIGKRIARTTTRHRSACLSPPSLLTFNVVWCGVVWCAAFAKPSKSQLILQHRLDARFIYSRSSIHHRPRPFVHTKLNKVLCNSYHHRHHVLGEGREWYSRSACLIHNR